MPTIPGAQALGIAPISHVILTYPWPKILMFMIMINRYAQYGQHPGELRSATKSRCSEPHDSANCYAGVYDGSYMLGSGEWG